MLISLMTIFYMKVDAADLNISYQMNGDKYELIFKEDDKVINYDDANKNYHLGDYFVYSIEGMDHYFYKGSEISFEEYNSGKKIEEKKAVCNNEDIYCIDIANREELESKVDEIFTSGKVGEYHLLYSSDKLDMADYLKTFRDKYMSPLNKNYYKYGEYGLRQPLKLEPYYDENELIINNMTIKTNAEEESKVDKFLEEFLKEFENKSDYEKVLGVYSYISKTAKYVTDDGYIKFIDGKLSPYDVLLTHETVCIGSSTTFQFLMEKLGVESYIIDHVEDRSDNVYSTSHSYNVVKLDDNWYIVDINAPSSKSSMLIGNDGSYDLEDFRYLGITVSSKSYNELHPDAIKEYDMDYDKYVALADSLVDKSSKEDNKEEKEDNNKESKKNSYLSYIYVLGILLVIAVIIIHFTRKD